MSILFIHAPEKDNLEGVTLRKNILHYISIAFNRIVTVKVKESDQSNVQQHNPWSTGPAQSLCRHAKKAADTSSNQMYPFNSSHLHIQHFLNTNSEMIMDVCNVQGKVRASDWL